MAISNVSNEVVFGEESTYGTLASTFTEQFGAIESFSYTEVETIEQIGSVGSGHNPLRNEAGLYSVTGTLVTKPTKAALPRLLELFFGTRVDATDYTITDSIDVTSISAKAQHSLTQTAQITGIVFTTISIDASKDGFATISMDYIGQKLTVATETVSYTQPTESLFSWLDIFGTYNSNSVEANTWTITGDWGIDAGQGRGIESVAAGSRRLIQRVIKNNLVLGGNVDLVVQDTNEMGYEDEKTDRTMVLTMSRGTDNTHVFTLTGCQLDNKASEQTPEDGIKNFTADFVALDISITGDL